MIAIAVLITAYVHLSCNSNILCQYYPYVQKRADSENYQVPDPKSGNSHPWPTADRQDCTCT